MKRLLRSLKKHPAVYEFLRYGIFARIRSINREHVFLKIYEDNYWEGDISVSGPGSSLKSTQALRKALPNLLATLGARSISGHPVRRFSMDEGCTPWC
jgi:hypothetical protein